jgi:hypothetical protein
MYEDLIKLIDRSRVAFPKTGSGVSPARISRAEATLGFPLPESYKWWLLNYGGGQIKGDIVYGLDENDMGRPDIVELARMNEQDGLCEKNKLVFSIGNAENFFFDLTVLKNGEYLVFTHDITQNDVVQYASNFADFLRKRIYELCGVA